MAIFSATYVSANTFTVPGDVRDYFPAKIRVRVDCGGWVQSSVASTSYSAPNTSVILTQSVLTSPCGNAEIYVQHPDGVPIHTHENDNTGGTGVVGSPPNHAWDGTSLGIQNPDGSWGYYTELTGPAGVSSSTLAEDNVSYLSTEFDVANGDVFSTGQAILLTDGTNVDYFLISSVSSNTLTVAPTGTGSGHTDYDTGDDVFPCGFGPWYKGSWALSTSYVLNHMVVNDGSGYICIQAHTSDATTEPGTGAYWSTYWDVLASKGDPGATGAAGAAGVNGSDGDPIVWESDWAISTAYTALDAVANDGSSYICTSDHTSDATNEPGTGAYWSSYWDLMAEKGVDGVIGSNGDPIVWENNWLTSTLYSELDAVANDGNSYICISDHTSDATNEPGTGAYWETYWDLMAQKGSAGASGGMQYESDWATSTAYVIDDVVVNDSAAYVCISDHTSGATDEPGTGTYWETYWELLAGGGSSGGGSGADVRLERSDANTLSLGGVPGTSKTLNVNGTSQDLSTPVTLDTDSATDYLISESGGTVSIGSTALSALTTGYNDYTVLYQYMTDASTCWNFSSPTTKDYRNSLIISDKAPTEQGGYMATSGDGTGARHVGWIFLDSSRELTTDMNVLSAFNCLEELWFSVGSSGWSALAGTAYTNMESGSVRVLVGINSILASQGSAKCNNNSASSNLVALDIFYDAVVKTLTRWETISTNAGNPSDIECTTFFSSKESSVAVIEVIFKIKTYNSNGSPQYNPSQCELQVTRRSA